jgi:hypothetical protein
LRAILQLSERREKYIIPLGVITFQTIIIPMQTFSQFFKFEDYMVSQFRTETQNVSHKVAKIADCTDTKTNAPSPAGP